MSKYGPNVTKLITKFIAREAVPPGGGLASGIEFLTNPELRKKVLEGAELKAVQAIQLVKSAPDNPFGNDDERIASELLDQIEKRQLTQRATDDGDALLFDGSQKMECGHEAKFIVYSERRNYCGICGQDAHPFNSWLRPARRR